MKTPYPASDSALNTEAYAKRFRNQATGTGNTLLTSEVTGRMRSSRVIDQAPDCMLPLAQGYPAPQPSMHIDGTLRDRLTGKPWKPSTDVGPHL